MLIGNLPKPVLEQVARVFPFDQFAEHYVCSSGSFRLEQMLAQVGGSGLVISNDATLISCAIGTLAATGTCLPFTFVEKLDFFEPALRGTPPRARVASLLVAEEMGKYTAENEWARTHFGHYRAHFSDYLDKATKKLEAALARLRIHRFCARDFREHACEAIERHAAVLCYPPLKSGEAAYRFVHDNVCWEPPSCAPLDPGELESWVRELHEHGASYCILAEQRFEELEPVGAFETTSKRVTYIYAREGRSSYARQDYNLVPFQYTTVEAADIQPGAVVQIVPAITGHMNFLKERFLAKNIAHVSGDLNFLVFVDGKLAGGFIYKRAKHDPMRTLYILSDFSVSRERRISKLVAMLATCRRTVALAEAKLLIKVEEMVTTAFTDRPISMKYRGIYELTARGPGHLQYASKVRDQSPEEIYREWYQRHASASAHADHEGEAP
jgi:hypothetical protein